MNTHDAIKKMIRTSGKTQDGVSVELGKSKNWLSATFAAASDSKASTVAALCSKCGYALALVPRDDLPGTAIEIEAD